MKNLIRIQILVTLLLTMISVLFTKAQALPPPPETFKINCKSTEIGQLDMSFSKPTLLTGNGAVWYYNVDMDRYNNDGQLLARETYSIKTQKDKNNIKARLVLYENSYSTDVREDVLELELPELIPNWEANSDKCYVQSTSPGIDLTIGLTTQSIITTHGYGQSFIEKFSANPKIVVKYEYDRFSSYPNLVDTLNGVKCPYIETSVVAKKQISCTVIK